MQVNKPALSESWTQEDQARALFEGWGVFDNGCYVEIQRYDAPDDGSEPKFDGDASAYDYVFLKAGNDPYYAKALVHVNESNGVKEKIGAPSNTITTLIDGSHLNLPWKTTKRAIRTPMGHLMPLRSSTRTTWWLQRVKTAVLQRRSKRLSMQLVICLVLRWQ
jgi:hypothetical protein